MQIIFSKAAWDDYLYWQKQDKSILKKINKLIAETIRQPFTGTGKPEPLKYQLQGYYSRRITDEHRFVYRVDGDSLIIVSVRYHYK